MISARSLTKRYGSKAVVDDLSFDVRPGTVTGFLGPNGAGKSTTMRMLVGLDHVDGGSATLNGRRFAELAAPMHEVGVLLDAGYLHPTRTARNHLWALAVSNGIARGRVDEVLGLVGLSDVAGRRVGQFSLGMRQRLGLAAALLGDPSIIILDEPANGLDPEGVRWIREFLGYLAGQGRTVFASSHLLSEMALMANELVVIGNGRLIAQTTVAAMIDNAGRSAVVVRSPRLDELTIALASAGASVVRDADTVAVENWEPAAVGRLAFERGIEIHELARRAPSLEDAFLQLTADAQEYRAEASPLNPSVVSPPVSAAAAVVAVTAAATTALVGSPR